MKAILITSGIVLFLGLTGCNQHSDSSDSGIKLDDPVELDVYAGVSLCDSISDREVTSTAVWFWKRNFKKVYENLLQGTKPEGLQRTFSKTNLLRLQRMYPSSTGLRVYYLLNPSGNVPNLALVNVSSKDCQSDTTDKTSTMANILVSNSDTGYFCMYDTINSLAANWHDYMDALSENYAHVYGYNYQWETVWNMLKDTVNTNPLRIDTLDLVIRHGMHALSAYDIAGLLYQTPPANESPQLEGLIAYALVLTNSTDTHLLTEGPHPYYDFSMPCPQLCGDLGEGDGEGSRR